LSYRGKREGGYGDPRRRSSPVVYYQGISGSRRNLNGCALPQYTAPENTRQTQGAKQIQPLELWLEASPSLTSPGFAGKFLPNSDPKEDAEALAKVAVKRKIALSI
jgi:hypothetical protein